MTTTVQNVQARTAYLQTTQAIYRAIDTLKDQLAAHEDAAQATGTHWGHVGDLTDILATLQRMTTQDA